jgi:hypothetical protein
MYWHTLPCCIASKDASAAEGGFRRRPLRQQKVRVMEGDCRPATRIRLAAVKRDLRLFDHLCSHATVLLLLCPLFGNESGRTCVGLGMYGHLLPLVLPRNLLLMRRFLRLPGRQWKSGHPGCRQDGDSHQNSSNRSKRQPPHVCCDRQGQQRRCGRSRRSRRARNSLSFNCIRLATHLLLQRSIGGLAWGVPFNPHCIGYFHSSVRICITGHKEEGAFLARQST